MINKHFNLPNSNPLPRGSLMLPAVSSVNFYFDTEKLGFCHSVISYLFDRFLYLS